MKRVVTLGLAIAALFCVAAGKPIKPGTNTPYQGYITSGERFGVHIGDTLEQADKALKANLKIGFQNPDGGCEHHLKRITPCDEMQRVDFYYVDQWFRNGELFIESRDGRVVSIIWDTQLRPYIDF